MTRPTSNLQPLSSQDRCGAPATHEIVDPVTHEVNPKMPITHLCPRHAKGWAGSTGSKPLRIANSMLVVLVLGMLATSASADPTPNPASTPLTTAEILYNDGQTAYDTTDYATAIAKWQASYDISGESDLLFNIAQAYRLSGDCGHALTAYRRFMVALDPMADQRKLANDFVRELEPRCPQTPVVVAQKADPQRSTLKIAGLSAGGAGIVSLAIGVGFGHRASTLGGEVTRACSVFCDWTKEHSKDVAGRRDAVVGYAFDALGMAAIAGGAALYYLGYRETAIHVEPIAQLHESGAVLSWSTPW